MEQQCTFAIYKSLSMRIITILIILFVNFEKANSQIFEFGFVNSDINHLLEELPDNRLSKIELIGIPYFNTIDPFAELNDSTLRRSLKPFILKAKDKCKGKSIIQQDGEVIGVLDGNVLFSIHREFETNQYRVYYKDDIIDYDALNSLVKSMLGIDLNYGFIVFNRDMNKYFITHNKEFFYYNFKSLKFEKL